MPAFQEDLGAYVMFVESASTRAVGRPRVVHLSSAHPATDTRILLKECQSLSKAGYSVTLIARSDYDTEFEGVRVRAVSSRSGNRLLRMTKVAFQVLRMALEENADVYHFHDPELIPAGLFLKLKGKRVIYDVHENMAKQLLTKHWVPKLIRPTASWAVRCVERVSSLALDGIVAATPGIAEVFPTHKTTVVQNFALVEELVGISIDDYKQRGPLIAYVGGLTDNRGLIQMVRSMARVGREADGRLLLAGSFVPKDLEQRIRNEIGYGHVDFLGWLDRAEVRSLLAKSRVGMLVLHPAPNYVDSYPVKLFEYMAAGLPVIASDFPFWHQFISDNQAGLMVDPYNEEEIAEAILWLLNNPVKAQAMGERGRHAVLDRYTWEQEFGKLLDLYRQVLSKNGRI